MMTVLMTVFNTPSGMLDTAIWSIRRQTFQHFEFLIIDDGSESPDTRSVLVRHASEDPRIRLAWEPHRGLTASLNRGLALASGEWIARQDADDWSEPDRLEHQLAYFHADTSLEVCGTNALGHREDGSPLWATHLPETAQAISQALWHGNPFVHGSTMFRRESALGIGGYRTQFPCAQDYDFFWRLSEKGRVLNVPLPLYHYRYTGGAVSARKAGEQARAHRATQRLAKARHRREPENIEAELAEARRELSASQAPLRVELKQADHRMLAGDLWGACRAYLRLLAVNPQSGLAWGKLARFAIFATFPPAREACFR
jgi:glycosyltransferase involved in cell wall biosynthesis